MVFLWCPFKRSADVVVLLCNKEDGNMEIELNEIELRLLMSFRNEAIRQEILTFLDILETVSDDLEEGSSPSL